MGNPRVSAGDPCPCGADSTYSECCGVYHVRVGEAPSPEALMRSRYSAFVVGDFDYLLATHDPQTRDPRSLTANRQWAEAVTFTGLEVLSASCTGNKGEVEFKARFRDASGDHVHQERSRFRRQGGIWYYRDGR